MTDASRHQDAPGTSHGATDTGAGLPDWRPERSTDRWRLGSHNPFTVYRVADGAHDAEHAREHFVCAFRREEDARLAVDAVNAQAGEETASEVLHRLGSGSGPGWSRTAHCCEEMTRRLAETCPDCTAPWKCPDLLVTGPPASNDYGLWVHDGGSSYIVIRHCPWCGTELPSDEHERSTEHDEDSDESTGSVDGEWVDDPSRSDHPVYECNLDRWCAMCGDPASHKVGEEAPTRVPDNTNDAMIAAGHNLTNWLCCLHFRSVIGDCGDRRTGDDRVNAPRDDPDRTMLPAGSAVGQRGAPTRDARGEAEAVAKAFGRLCGGDDGASWDDEEEIAVPREWVRRAYRLSLAALRDDGADTGREGGELKPLSEVRDAQAIPTMWYSPSRAMLGGSRTDGLIVQRDGDPSRLYGYSARALGWRLLDRLLPDDAILLVGHGDYAHPSAITRIADALGVSLDPDDPDPVGRLVEAAGKAREVEVVNGQDVASLPHGSVVLYVGGDAPESGNAYQVVAGQLYVPGVQGPVGGLRIGPYFRLLHRASEPQAMKKPLTVGEVVESAADLDRRATVGTIVESETGSLYKLDRGVTAHDVDLYPAIVVRVGTGGGES